MSESAYPAEFWRAGVLWVGIVATAALAYAVVVTCGNSRLKREKAEANRQRDVLLRELEAGVVQVVGVVPVVVPLRIPEPVREGPVPRGVLGGRSWK